MRLERIPQWWKDQTAVQRAQEPVTPKPVKFESLLDRMNEVFNDISKRVF